jgi:type II secretory pathway pseudopilin PulG
MMTTPVRRPVKSSEEGYILVAVIFMLAILIISLAVAAPKMAREIQRDRELETMQRGKQYIRAIRMYYKKNNAYPPNIDALIKPSNAIGIRYLRKRYADPTTGKDEWKPIHFGQNKAPTAMGFFGQPLGGSTLAGIGSGGAGNIAGASAAGSSFMSGNSTTGTNGASNAAGGTAGTTTDGSAASGSTTNGNSSTGGDSAFGSSGQTFGGLGIIGFSPNSPKASILIYKTKSHYNEWEFVYDPIVERMMLGGISGAGSGGVPAGNLGNGTSVTPTQPVQQSPPPTQQ